MHFSPPSKPEKKQLLTEPRPVPTSISWNRVGTGAVNGTFFFVVWVRFMQHLQVWEYLEKQDALSAGPDFLGAVGILLATTHERADFNSRR
jgi:hypothetical protein